MTHDPAVIQLWHVGPLHCSLTAFEAGPPFVVEVFDVDHSQSRVEFQTHDSATLAAIEQMIAARKLHPV
jgi:hypothetical protein